MLKGIIANQKNFSLETLKAEGVNITDAKEIANKLKEHFGMASIPMRWRENWTRM